MINRRASLSETVKAYIYLLPVLIISGTFSLYPLIKSVLMSFYVKYDFYSDTVQQYGLDNYDFLIHDSNFHLAIKNTFILVVGVVPLTIIISLAIALMLNKIKFLKSFFRTAYFLPFVTSTVAISLVWSWIFNRDNGLLNYLLSLVGVQQIDWLNDPNWAVVALIIMSIWKGLGFNIVLFLVGINNINPDFYKVAKLDGANSWQQFINVTLPLLSPTTFLVSIMGVINGFKVFDSIFALFHGQPGPAKSALTIVYYLYDKFYTEWKYGIAAASSVVLLLIILGVTLIQFLYSRRHVHY